MDSTDPLFETLRGIATGLEPWSELNQVGFAVTRVQEEWLFAPYHGRRYLLTEQDLEAALHNLAHSALKSREWASFVLAASDFLDLEGSPGIPDKLWDLAFGD